MGSGGGDNVGSGGDRRSFAAAILGERTTSRERKYGSYERGNGILGQIEEKGKVNLKSCLENNLFLI